jgi:hypothetical protein
MFKLLTIALAATSIGTAGATTAYAYGCSCHSKSASVSAPESAPTEKAPEAAPKSAAHAPSTGRTNRSYSYEPALAPNSGAFARSYNGPTVRRSSRTTRSELSIDKAMRAKGY